jgi:uncharacterized cupin superfamily protein
MDAVPSIATTDANSMSLPAHVPKPTSLDGQTETSASTWTSADGTAESGVWECTAGTFTARRDGYDEIAIILSGTATVRSDTGETVDLGPGSIFVTPAGWTGVWTVHDTIRKVYVIRNLA